MSKLESNQIVYSTSWSEQKKFEERKRAYLNSPAHKRAVQLMNICSTFGLHRLIACKKGRI